MYFIYSDIITKIYIFAGWDSSVISDSGKTIESFTSFTDFGKPRFKHSQTNGGAMQRQSMDATELIFLDAIMAGYNEMHPAGRKVRQHVAMHMSIKEFSMYETAVSYS